MPEQPGKQYSISCMSLGLPVQAPILNRLGNMLFMNGIAPVKVRNSAGHFEDSGIGSRRKAEPVGNQFQHEVAARVQLTVFFDEAGCHLGRLAAGAYMRCQFHTISSQGGHVCRHDTKRLSCSSDYHW